MKITNRIKTLLFCGIALASIVGIAIVIQVVTNPIEQAPGPAINPDFSADLYQQLRTEEGNVFFSPYSISEAMGMVYAGSGGNTAKEISKALSFGEDSKSLGPKMKEMRRYLMRQANIKDNKLSIANALCMTGDKPLRSYQDTVREQFDGEIFTGGLDSINAWVNKKTEGNIEKILDELSPHSACVILNAVYFKGNWKSSFEASATHKDKFQITPEKDVQVDMMTQENSFKVLCENGLIAVDLPYETSASMVLIMPEKAKGMRELEATLNDTMIEGLCKKLQGSGAEKIVLFMPKFKLANSYDLVEPLKKLGMSDAFDFDKADFKSMYKDFPVRIDQIKHKATLEVDEKGTVATATTAVIMEGKSASSLNIIRFDRPFLFLIRENTSGTNLFMGRINDPTAE